MPVVLDPPGVTRGGGSPGRKVSGSGRAIPTSIGTTKYEFNGLVLNDRDALEHYWVEKIDGLYDAEVRDNREQRSDEDGETFYGNLHAGKPIQLEGWIKALTYEKWLDMRMAFAAAFDDIASELPLVGRTGDITRDWQVFVVKTGQIGLPDEIKSYEFKTPFMVPLRASRPRIYSLQQRFVSQQLYMGSTFKITNLGTKPAYPIIRIHGQQRGVQIINFATNQVWSMKSDRIVPAGRVFTVDMEAGTIYDDLGINRFDYFDHSSDWPLMLKPETEQDISIVSDLHDANSAIAMLWHDTYK